MSLEREQILAEMGIAPIWQRRASLEVARASSLPERAPESADPAPEAPPLDEAPQPFAQTAQETSLADSAVSVANLDWVPLRESIAACRACPLCAGRKQTVPGVGDEAADWLFVGEGPGAEEDERGEPFVGQAGKLLDAMLAALDLARGENVYIANAVKCHPPANRTPEAQEIAACAPFLARQIALLQPRVIVLLGRAAAHAVLGESAASATLASLRGKPLTYRQGEREIPVVVTYHPAYLLRTLPDKIKAWEDLCRARALMRSLP